MHPWLIPNPPAPPRMSGHFPSGVYAEQSHEAIIRATSREQAEALMWERIGENGEDIDDLGEPITWGVNVVVVPFIEPLRIDGEA